MNKLISFSIFNSTSIETSANISDFVVKDINLNEVKLSEYKDKVLLIVNVARQVLRRVISRDMKKRRSI